jgi:RNA polymerase sigma factor (sigma-70 family)
VTLPPSFERRCHEVAEVANAAPSDDAAVVASLQDPGCFAVVFDRYFAEIHGYAARRLGSQAADDIAAETFMTAFRKRATYDVARGSVRAWLYGIATNHLSRHRRRETRAYRALERAGVSSGDEDAQERVVDRMTAHAAHRQLAVALAALSPGDRDVLLLIALADLSHAEVASALGIPYGTVGSRLSRTRKKLRSALGGVSPADYRED